MRIDGVCSVLRISMLVLVCWLAGSAFALAPTGTALYNVDFGPEGVGAYAGRGLLGGVADHYWNKLTTVELNNVVLKTSEGLTGTMTLCATGFGGSWSHPGVNNRFGWDNFGDYWFVKKDAPAATLTLGNLPADSSYTLLLYALPGGFDRVIQAAIDHGTPQRTADHVNGWDYINWVAAPAERSNYLQFTGTVPHNGNLTLNISAVGTDIYGDIEGLQVQVSTAKDLPTIQTPKAVGYGSLLSNLKAGREQRAMFVGTSLTAGCSWPTALQSALSNKYEGRMIISDRAIAATQSNSGVSHIDGWLKEDHPDAVFIEYGINDAWGTNISTTLSRANLDTMVAAILKSNPDTDIILLTMDNPIEKNLEVRPNIETYYQLYRDYATTHGMTLIDDYPLWKHLYDTDAAQWKLYVPDGIHPTFEGNRAVVLANMISSLEQAALRHK